MDHLFRKIELIANVAIILVAVSMGIVLFRKHVSPVRLSNAEPPVSTVQTSNHLKLGIPGVDWSKHERTVVLALSSSCHFCTESAPFYQQLAKSRGAARMIAVLPQSVEEGRQYLSKLGFEVDSIVQAPLNSINVNGTPTLLLVDRDGALVGTWVGRLAAEKQMEVLTELRETAAKD